MLPCERDNPFYIPLFVSPLFELHPVVVTFIRFQISLMSDTAQHKENFDLVFMPQHKIC
jgi:hypothetical protein